MKKIPLITASYRDLVRFAQENGLDARMRVHDKETVISMIRAAMPNVDEIEVEEEAEPAAKSNVSKITNAAHYNNDPKVVVNIASDPANGGSRHFPIAVNGDQILVARDTDVPIPYRHYLALENAVETVFRQEQDPLTGTPKTIASQRKAVSYTVRKMPASDEIEAFHRNTADIGRESPRAAA